MASSILFVIRTINKYNDLCRLLSKHKNPIDLMLFVTRQTQSPMKDCVWLRMKNYNHLPTATMPDSTFPDISLQMLFTMSRPHICWYSWNTARITRWQLLIWIQHDAAQRHPQIAWNSDEWTVTSSQLRNYLLQVWAHAHLAILADAKYGCIYING